MSATTSADGAEGSCSRSPGAGPNPNASTGAWHRERARNDFGLGVTQLVRVASDTWVANMIGQHGIKTTQAGPPVRYAAIEQALRGVADHAVPCGASVLMPRVGCGLAGGSWDRIEPIRVRTLIERGVPTTIYDLAEDPSTH